MDIAALTKEAFEAEYCARSGITLEALRARGREALPCDCGEPLCQGWQMGFHNDPAHFPDKHTVACRERGVCVAHCCEASTKETSHGPC